MPRSLFVFLLCSCGFGPEVFGSDVDVTPAIDEACDRWPDTCDVGQRLDVFVEDDVSGYSECGRAKAKDPTSCLLWIGSTFSRARVFTTPDDVNAAVLHELQHAHLWTHVDACASHSPECGWADVPPPAICDESGL